MSMERSDVPSSPFSNLMSTRAQAKHLEKHARLEQAKVIRPVSLARAALHIAPSSGPMA